jgi:hypothetical protein
MGMTGSPPGEFSLIPPGTKIPGQVSRRAEDCLCHPPLPDYSKKLDRDVADRHVDQAIQDKGYPYGCHQ